MIVRNDHLLIVKEERMMINKEIENLIIKALFKEITDDEQRRLDEWLNISEGNRIFFDRLHSERYLKGAIGDRNRELRKEGWKRLEERTIGKRSHKIRIFVLRVAAMLALPLLVGGIMWYISERGGADLPLANQEIKIGGSKAVVTLSSGEQLSLFGDTIVCVNDGLATLVNMKDTLNFMKSNHPVVADNSYNVIQIPRGGEYKLFLSDNTEVFLNSDSEIRFPVKFGKGKRDVFLRGEAFFVVTKDASRPFVVNANDKMSVEVLGTQFNLQAYPDDAFVETTLNEGAVRVFNGKQGVRLRPDEQAVYDEGKFTVRKVDASSYSAWKEGRFMLLNHSLENIMTRLARWYNIDIFWENPEVKEYHFSGELARYEDFTEILRMLELATRVHFEVKDRTVFVRKIEE